MQSCFSGALYRQRLLLLGLSSSYCVQARPATTYCISSKHHFSSSLRLRRPRIYKGHIKDVGRTQKFGQLEDPYEHGEETMDDYLKKTSLSPYAPMPDAVARKIFDLAKAVPEDFHVDLGSGDGRVNFHAIDYGVKKSLGVDVDETIVGIARERLMKRYPLPDLEFLVADLLDADHPVWEKIQKASIITMYFAEEALKIFRPILEKKLAGREIKILTCGYEMPGWSSRTEEVVLGTTIYYYEWGSPIDEDYVNFMDEDFTDEEVFPQNLGPSRSFSQKFPGMKVVDRTDNWPIQGFNPDLFFEEEDSDEDWDAESSEDEDEAEAGKRSKEDIVEKYANANRKPASTELSDSDSAVIDSTADK